MRADNHVFSAFRVLRSLGVLRAAFVAALLIAAANCCNGQDSLKIQAVSEAKAYVGDVVNLEITGLPAIDESQNLGDAFSWTDRLSLLADAPEGVKVDLKTSIGFDLGANGGKSWRVDVRVKADKPCTLFVVASFGTDKEPKLACHRLTISRRGPPPQPAVTLEASVNGKPATHPGPSVRVGEPVVLSFSARNTGNVPLEQVSLTAVGFEGPAGDDGDGVLSVGETWTWSGSSLAVSGEQNVSGSLSAHHEEVGEVSYQAFASYVGEDKPAPGNRFIVVAYEAQDQTPAIADLIADIRVDIDKAGKHKFVPTDVDSTAEWFSEYKRRASGKDLPQVFIVTDGGEILHQGKLPGTLAEFNRTLAEFGG